MDYHQNARLTVVSRADVPRGCGPWADVDAGRGQLQRQREDGGQVGAALPRSRGCRAVGSQLEAEEAAGTDLRRAGGTRGVVAA
jgi:hypothetical protein